MCGIAGWVDWQHDITRDPSIVERMGETLQARGPDAKGTWLTTHCGFAHQRLSVIDPQNGIQPMIRQQAGRTYALVYNGELYNAAELRKTLEWRGYTFTTHCDTEVLLVALIEWGLAAAERLNGIFAFGFWDESRQRLLLVRDRLGVKPLFYSALRGGGCLFGSEPKALLAHPACRPVVDAAGFAELFAIGPARTPGHGIYRDIRELRPGHWLSVTPDAVTTGAYWRLEAQPHPHDLAQTVQAVRALLSDTVERQLISDVPLGTLLSGGLDSSALTALAQHHLLHQGGERGDLRTFSIDYQDQSTYFQANAFQPSDDQPYIACMTEALGTTHHAVTLDADTLVDALTASLRARDLPGMVDIDSSLLLFCRAIKREVTVALSGEAADEVFGGYPWFTRAEAGEPLTTFPWSASRAAGFRFLTAQTHDWLKLDDYASARFREALDKCPQLPGDSPLEATMRRMSYLNITRFMPTLLDRKDRMSMATGLEVRVPFCDHRLVEYVFNVPWALKSAGNQEKGLLRLAVEPLLPEKITKRKKSPYPKTHNPAYTSAIQQRLHERLQDPHSPLRPFVDQQVLEEMASANHGAPWFGQLMAGPQLFAYLLQIDEWMRTYKVQIG
jgi:asparagine synthase (glutamine-hydrolysing)